MINVRVVHAVYVFIVLLLVLPASSTCDSKVLPAADNDARTGAGMHEFSVFQVNAYVIGNAFTPSVMEEHQVTFL